MVAATGKGLAKGITHRTESTVQMARSTRA
jgi:hypothetical protein